MGGGFDVVGKISGTLLAASNTLRGEKEQANEDGPSNVISGTYEGVKGGLIDIGKGFAGIFINPYKSAKKEGVKGFFKGVGTGLIGAVISPFSAAFRIINSVSVGMKNTVNMFSAGKLKTERFRHPRHIVKNIPLTGYDENYAEVQEIMRTLGDLKDNKLVFFHDFKFEDEDYEKDICTLIITDKNIVVCANGKKQIMCIPLDRLSNTEVHSTHNKEVFLIVFYWTGGKRTCISTDNLQFCCQVHLVLQKLLETDVVTKKNTLNIDKSQMDRKK